VTVTVQDCLTAARLDLADATTNIVTGSAITPRYPDSDLLKFANDGIATALTMRPDLNFGNYGTAYVDLVATSSFPLPLEYRTAITSYIVFRNQSGDDAFALQGRADQNFAEYLKELGL
jgi:hypothetical protein